MTRRIENFSYDGYIDIFDGGPTIGSPRPDGRDQHPQCPKIPPRHQALLLKANTKVIIRSNLGDFPGKLSPLLSENDDGVRSRKTASRSNIGLSRSVHDQLLYFPR